MEASSASSRAASTSLAAAATAADGVPGVFGAAFVEAAPVDAAGGAIGHQVIASTRELTADDAGAAAGAAGSAAVSIDALAVTAVSGIEPAVCFRTARRRALAAAAAAAALEALADNASASAAITRCGVTMIAAACATGSSAVAASV